MRCRGRENSNTFVPINMKSPDVVSQSRMCWLNIGLRSISTSFYHILTINSQQPFYNMPRECCRRGMCKILLSCSCLKLISPWSRWPPFWQTTFSNAFLTKMTEFRRISLNFFPSCLVDNKPAYWPAVLEEKTWIRKLGTAAKYDTPTKLIVNSNLVYP